MQYHVSRCPQQLASAFTHVLGVICGCKPSDVAYVSVTELEDYAWANARILPTNREFSENIVWLWVYAFMLINADTDIARLRGIGSQLSKQTILKLAIDLGQYFLSDVRHGEPEETHDGIHSTRSLVQRTWSCINIYAQLHAIGTGTEDWISTDNSKRLSPQPDIRSLLSESTAFLAGES